MYKQNSDILIQLKNLTKKFGDFTAVDHANIDIRRGEVVGFLGPNGAGKSTTMKMIARLLRPNVGEVWIRHEDILQLVTDDNKDVLLDQIGFLIENPAFYESSTPRQLLTYFAKLKGYPRSKIKERVEEVIGLVGLQTWIDMKMKTFSKGMRQKIGVISALVHDPDILVLDEPHTGLDPSARRELRDLLLKLKEMGKTIFLSSHLLYEVSAVADRVAIISNGRIVVFDTLENLEQMAQDSIIHVEILSNNIPPDVMVKQIFQCVSNLNDEQEVWYVPDAQVFKIRFNGKPEVQHDILRQLIEKNFKILEYSVPKAGLLEELYLKFIDSSNKFANQAIKETIEVESILSE